MDLQSRKISFVQEFLSIESEELISRFENLLKNKNTTLKNTELNSMTISDLNRRIDQSEDDSNKGRLTEMEDFLSEIEKWN
ncbi:hypothetical protein [Flavobacterium frigidarium]|jgi:translation initiation factor 2B subunit (eIF-2B alpha/beta/delta family)|uniref:hypothetical protein n=1 Tax=Flavobacterium frigidarium TaxID=99286 RepID=UPI00040F35BB|nr:hypothetical protein [Flavobacterium frigidarium]